MKKNILLSLSTLAICVAFSLAPAGAARAQQPAATLTGIVIDQHGAVVTGVAVRATQTATGAVRETATNGDGVYALSNLPPGTYEVSFKATGFDEKKTAVTLQVGQSVTA